MARIRSRAPDAGGWRAPAAQRSGQALALALTLAALLASPGAAQEPSEQEQVKQWMERCANDPEAARALESYLMERGLELLDGRPPPRDRLLRIVHGALRLTRSALSEEQRDLKDAECLKLADDAARLDPEPLERSESLAAVALERATHLRGSARLADARTELVNALDLDPPPAQQAAWLRIALAELALFEGADPEAHRQLKLAAHEATRIADLSLRSAALQRRALVLARLWLDLGCVDRADSALREARAALRGAPASSAQIQDLEEAVLALTRDEPRRAEELTSALLRDEGLRPDLRALAFERRGIAAIAAGEAGGFARARQDLLAALQLPLDPHDALDARLRLLELAVMEGDFAAAARDWKELEPRFADGDKAVAPSNLRERVLFRTLGARLARASHAARDELAAQRTLLEGVQEQLFAHWRGLPPVAGGVGRLHYGRDTDALIELCELDLALDGAGDGAARALGRLLEAQELGSAFRRTAPQPVSARDVQASLPAGGVLLAYLYGQAKSFVFVVDAERVRAYPLPNLFTLRPALEAFAHRFTLVQELRTVQLGKTAQAASELCAQLLPAEALARVLGADHVTVVGEDVPAPFPFEALRLPEGAWLGTRVALDHWPSMPIGQLWMKGPPVASEGEGRTLALAAPRAAEAGTAIELTQEQRARLAGAWPDLELVSGAEATKQALQEGLANGADALLLVVHGVPDPTGRSPTVLALAPGADDPTGLVWRNDIRALRAPALVVLGVCGAGREPQRRGEDGSLDLGSAWLERGTRCVIQSRFALERDSTVELLIQLGRARRPGVALAEALRAARAAVAEGRPDPFHHEMLQLVGDGR